MEWDDPVCISLDPVGGSTPDYNPCMPGIVTSAITMHGLISGTSPRITRARWQGCGRGHGLLTSSDCARQSFAVHSFIKIDSGQIDTPMMLLLSLIIISCAVLYVLSLSVRRDRLSSLLRKYCRQEKQSENLSCSGEKASSIKPAVKIEDYTAIFPPSQRHVLLQHLPLTNPTTTNSCSDVTFDQQVFQNNLLAWEGDYRQADDSQYVYSGFSIKQIKSLGDFSDYAFLSGIPLPKAAPTFDINKALPRPYRPFRWPYHQTMSLSKLEPDYWLELESTYKIRIAERKKLFEEHGGQVLQWLPGSELACKELMEMALQFLVARYPQYFSLTPDSLEKSKTIFENRILDMREVVQDRHPLWILLDHVPEDFAVMLRRPSDGAYVFRAGIICSAMGWNIATKIDKRLHEIHEPVPDYRDKMQFSMERYFSKMPTDKPIQRTSWGLEVDQPLYMPPGHPHERYRSVQDPGLAPDRIHLRTDHQTLRRLPLSGAVVFNFKALFTPVTEFRDEPYIPSLLLKICREAKKSLLQYKATWHVEHVLFPMLEQFERDQIAAGVMARQWSGQTLDEHPFFPGWRDKWHQQQGF